jgi:hypothetical protein
MMRSLSPILARSVSVTTLIVKSHLHRHVATLVITKTLVSAVRLRTVDERPFDTTSARSPWVVAPLTLPILPKAREPLFRQPSA